MTDPSPQEELRAEIANVLAQTSLRDEATLAQIEGWAETYLVPLFAARVAAIEAQLDVYRGHCDHLAQAERAEADLTAAQERIAAAIKERDVALDLVEDWSTDCREVEKQRDAALSRLAAERKQAAAQALRRAADELPGADLSEFRIEQWTTDTEKVQGWLRYRASRMETP